VSGFLCRQWAVGPDPRPAEYRLGKYQEAVETLAQSDQLNTARKSGFLPAGLAFLAMAHYRLGEKDRAQDYLNRLRENLKQRRPGSEISQEDSFLSEAEALFRKQTENATK
jgi:hypothetical protein